MEELNSKLETLYTKMFHIDEQLKETETLSPKWESLILEYRSLDIEADKTVGEIVQLLNKKTSDV